MTRRLDEHILAEMAWMEQLLSGGDDPASWERRRQAIRARRAESPEWSERLDHLLLMEIHRKNQGLQEARGNLEKMRQILEKLTAPPWHMAVFVCPIETEEGVRALVYHGTGRRVVNLMEGFDLTSLEPGDEVFLGNELNVIMSKSPDDIPRVGETAVFSRYTEDGRLIIQLRDEELIIAAAGSLRDVKLESGDIVRWDKTCWMAFEKIPHDEGRRYFLDELPQIGPEQVGGQSANLRKLLASLTAKLVNPGLAATYGLDGRQSVLMVGPPGCGKTLMARVAASEVGRLSGKKCRFAVVKPGAWEDPFVGVTQRNIRHCFQALKEASKETFAVLFLDEIETVGRIRGSIVGHHSDKFLGALLAELDGFDQRGNVAVIAATNRKDLCDPSLLQRLGDVEIEVARPDPRGATEIFRIHMPDSYPYSPNGSAAAHTREDAIDAAVSQLYAPNAGNEVCTLKFRDNKTRLVTARELTCGRIIEQICRDARRTAYLRHSEGGEPGIRVEDMREAVATAMDHMSTIITPRNAHAYLFDLPQDIDVVAVEPIRRRPGRGHRYVNPR